MLPEIYSLVGQGKELVHSSHTVYWLDIARKFVIFSLLFSLDQFTPYKFTLTGTVPVQLCQPSNASFSRLSSLLLASNSLSGSLDLSNCGNLVSISLRVSQLVVQES